MALTLWILITNRDVSALGTVHHLTLSWCANIGDVSALRHVHTLRLEKCNNMTGLSNLGQNYNLRLYDYTNVGDVSSWGGIRILQLLRCEGIQGLSALKNVSTLSIESSTFTEPSALSDFYDLRTLTLTCENMMTNISAALSDLYCLHTVHLEGRNVTDISAFNRVHTLGRCPNIVDVSSLGRGCQTPLSKLRIPPAASPSVASGFSAD